MTVDNVEKVVLAWPEVMNRDQFLTAVLRNPINKIITEELFGSNFPTHGWFRGAWCRRCGTC